MSRYKILSQFFYLFFFFAVACSSQNSVPPRPESVPQEALWIGGLDGGAWVLLKKNQDDPDYIYRAEIYGDQAGDKWYIGRLEVVPNSKPNIPLKDAAAFGAWDGDNLLLKDGRILQSIDSFNPFEN